MSVLDNDSIATINQRLKKIKKKDFAHLAGRPITVQDASKKYDVPVTTIRTWIHRGHVSPLGMKGRHRLIDEADVAYCAAIYHVRKPFGSRGPLLEKDGSPYLLRDPLLAYLRRLAKKMGMTEETK